MSKYVEDLEDRLRGQRAEIERLREEVERLDAVASDVHEERLACCLRVERENATLRARLEKAIAFIDDPEGCCCYPELVCEQCEFVASLRGEEG